MTGAANHTPDTNPPPRVEVPIPAQLPADAGGFTGRAPQLAELDTLLSDTGGTAVLSTVTGTGGAGKTALAIHWARRNQDRFPDGQLYVNLRGFDPGEPVGAQEALSRFLHALGLSGDAVPADVETAAGLFRSLIADRRMLVVLDNARDMAQVRPLLPGGGGNVALITSRNKLTGLAVSHGATTINVDVLSRGESVSVLSTVVGPQRIAAEPEAADRLADLCADLPLALRIAGANFVLRPYESLRAYVDELEGPDRLDLLSIDGDPRAAVAGTFSLSFRALPPDVQRFFSIIGLIPGDDFSEDLAASLDDVSKAEVRGMLRRLATGHLIEEHGNRRYRLHDLVRAYARRTAEDSLSESARNSVADRIVNWFHANRLRPVFEEYGNLVAAFRAWSDHPRCLDLVPTFGAYVNIGRDLKAIREYLDAAEALAIRLNDPRGMYQVVNALGIWASTSGDLDAAIEYGLRSVAHSMEHNGDSEGVARGNLGTYYVAHGEFRNALPVLRPAVETAITAHHPGAPFQILNLAGLFFELGEFDEVRNSLRRLESLNFATSGSAVLASTLRMRTQLHIVTGRYDLALQDAEAGLDETRREHHQRHECMAQLLRGVVRRRLDDHHGALRDISTALEIARRVRLFKQEAIALTELGPLLCQMGRTAEARDLLPALTDLAENSANKKRRSESFKALATIHFHFGDHELAIQCGSSAAEIFAALPNPLEHASTLSIVADAHDALADHDAARRHYDGARTIYSRLGIPEAEQLHRRFNARNASGTRP